MDWSRYLCQKDNLCQKDSIGLTDPTENSSYVMNGYSRLEDNINVFIKNNLLLLSKIPTSKLLQGDTDSTRNLTTYNAKCYKSCMLEVSAYESAVRCVL